MDEAKQWEPEAYAGWKALITLTQETGRRGDIEGTLAASKRAVGSARATFGADHANVARTMYEVALALENVGCIKEALEYLKQALELVRNQDR